MYTYVGSFLGERAAAAGCSGCARPMRIYGSRGGLCKSAGGIWLCGGPSCLAIIVWLFYGAHRGFRVRHEAGDDGGAVIIFMSVALGELFSGRVFWKKVGRYWLGGE